MSARQDFDPSDHVIPLSATDIVSVIMSPLASVYEITLFVMVPTIPLTVTVPAFELITRSSVWPLVLSEQVSKPSSGFPVLGSVVGKMAAILTSHENEPSVFRHVYSYVTSLSHVWLSLVHSMSVRQ